MSWDSYIGPTGHNYYLYEQDGRISIIPWDYNLAFGTYALGMTNPITDPNIIVNYPIDTPAWGSVMLNRPLYHNLMEDTGCFYSYHGYFDQLLTDCFESGLFEARVRSAAGLIAPYVMRDPTFYCTYSDHTAAVETLIEVCLLRAQSCRGQLEGEYPSTLRKQEESGASGVDASGVDLKSLGDFADLRWAKQRQDSALYAVSQGKDRAD